MGLPQDRRKMSFDTSKKHKAKGQWMMAMCEDPPRPSKSRGETYLEVRSGGRDIRARAAVERDISTDVIGWVCYGCGLDGVYSGIYVHL